MKNLGLYVHIPFCKSKCLYCDFNSFAGKEDTIAEYFCTLKQEIKAWGEKLKGRTFDTIYFGGGTPSYVGAELLSQVIEELYGSFDISKDCEITVECNPGTIDAEGLKKLRTAGANRLSIGLQSTCDSVLRTLGRIHSTDDFEKCFEAARRSGFENISLDLMYGLPDMTLKSWEKTIDRAMEFGAEHISAYALKIEEGTPFSKMNLSLPDEDVCADMYELLVGKLRGSGYARYEISNFSKPGKESRHNQKYWELTDFLGLGAGAHSCLNNVRFSNCEKIETYIERISENGFAITERTPISANEQMSEFVFMGLRCEKGISFSEFKNRFGKDLDEVFGEHIKKYSDWGFFVIDGDRLRFSDKGFFVSNTILADFV